MLEVFFHFLLLSPGRIFLFTSRWPLEERENNYQRRGSTLAPSISTETDLCRRSTEMTSFSFSSLIFSRNPSHPFKGPSTTRTRCPSFKYGKGETAALPFRIVRMDSIWISGTGIGPSSFPKIL